MAYLFEAKRAYREGNKAEAHRILEQLAAAKDARALLLLGQLTSSGDGVPSNPARAAVLYRASAELGNAGAATNLGSLHGSGRGVPKNLPEALRWYVRGGELGDPLGYLRAGRMCAFGDGVPVDLRRASTYFSIAAKTLTEAHYDLALLDEELDPLSAAEHLLQAPRDPEVLEQLRKLVPELRRRAATGDGRGVSQCALARVLRALEPGSSEVEPLLRRALEAGDRRAGGPLADLLRRRDRESANFPVIFELYLKAAEAGDVPSQISTAYMYAEGIGVPRDAEAAAVWYRRAAEQGNSTAAMDLAVVLRELSKGPEVDREVARCLAQAAAGGHAGAMIQLAEALSKGQGVERDLVQAARWVFAALGKGNGDGIHLLHGFARELSLAQLLEADALADGDDANALSTWMSFGGGAI